MKAFAGFVEDVAEREIDEFQIRHDAAEILRRQGSENIVLFGIGQNAICLSLRHVRPPGRLDQFPVRAYAGAPLDTVR